MPFPRLRGHILSPGATDEPTHTPEPRVRRPRHTRPLRRTARSCVCLLASLPIGCIVAQPAGRGQVIKLSETQTGAAYFLYLPAGYQPTDVPHPLVVTFHGLAPFDTAGAQIRQWQQEADRYGFVVIAPKLLMSAAGAPLPLNAIHPWLLRDERATLAIMDEVVHDVRVDPAAVLATSWSYGGYVAHYMVNRHPDRFTCLAVYQSNFNDEILDETTARRYRTTPIAIFYTQNDFKRNRIESQRAGVWYATRGFDVTFAKFAERGHERTPGPAAAFFAEHCGARAQTPPVELAVLQVVEPPDLDRIIPTQLGNPMDANPAQAWNTRIGETTMRPGRYDDPSAGSPPEPPPNAKRGASPATDKPHRPPIDTAEHEKPPPHKPGDRRRRNTIAMRVNTVIGIVPWTVDFRVDVPAGMRDVADYFWLLDDKPLCSGAAGRKTLTRPGDYELTVRVTDPTGLEYQASQTLTVLPRLDEPDR